MLQFSITRVRQEPQGAVNGCICSDAPWPAVKQDSLYFYFLFLFFNLNTTFFIRLFVILKRKNRQCSAGLTFFQGLRSAYGCSSSFQHKAWNRKEKDWHTQHAITRRGKSNPPCSQLFQSLWTISRMTTGTLPLVTWWVSSQQQTALGVQHGLWESPSQHGQEILASPLEPAWSCTQFAHLDWH